MNVENPNTKPDEAIGYESPTFGPKVNKPRHLPSFTGIHVEELQQVKKKVKKEKKEKTEKKKKKEHKPKEETSVPEKEVPQQEKKTKKLHKKHKQPTKSPEKTPKFAEQPSKQPKSNPSKLAPILKQTEIKMNKEEKEALQTDMISIMLPQPEKYNENMMLGLNIISYLKERHVPIGNKIFYSMMLLLLLASYIIGIWDLSLYARTTCEDTNSSAGMYFNFLLVLFTKVGIFNYFTSEVNADLQYDLKFPFLIPILATGVIANFQLPLVVYNYHTCEQRSPLIEMEFGYFIINIISMIIVGVFLFAIVTIVLLQRIKFSHTVVKMAKTVFYFATVCLMVILTFLFLFVSFSQIDSFSMTLMIENLLFWGFAASGGVVFVLRKRFGIEVFKPIIASNDGDKTIDEQTASIVELIAKSREVTPSTTTTTPTPWIKRNSLQKHLEKIEEKENEEDKSASASKIEVRKDKDKDMSEDFVIEVPLTPHTPQNVNNTVIKVFEEPVSKGL